MNWVADKVETDVYMRQVKRILGEHLIVTADYKQDAMENTDLILLTTGPVRIAVRLRRGGYSERYGDEFTVRCDRPSGNKTELAKIREGFGDYMFYGHRHGDEIPSWAIVDLGVFRDQYSTIRLSGKRQKNWDGSSDFVAFKLYSCPGLVLASEGVCSQPLTDTVSPPL